MTPSSPRHPSSLRRARLGVVAFAMVALGCARDAQVSPDDRAQIAAAESSVDSLRALARAEDWPQAHDDDHRPRLDEGGARALLYMERARLGLGSPFRLAESAVSDAGLPPGLRRPVAWALVAAAARGESYQVDAAALEETPDAWRPGGITDGTALRAVIDSVVGAAPSARTGEVAVRVGFALGRAERLVTVRVSEAAVAAAALARDRRLAREDAGRLLGAAAAAREEGSLADVDALSMLVRWRRERRFASERALLADDLRPDQAVAAREAERLVATLRKESADAALRNPAASPPSADSSARDTSAAVVAARGERAGACGPSDAVLGCRAAARLAGAEWVGQARPEPFVTITLGGFRSTITTEDALFPDSAVLADEKILVRRLAARARTADALAIEWTRLRATLPADAPVRRRLAMLVHAVAVAERPFAQSAVATTDDGRDVQAVADALRLQTGIGRIAFERGLPAAWRVPALRELEGAIADLRLALPSFTLDGLAVRVGSSPKGDLALALHEPTTRTIFLPPASGGGTIAHELAHDLDWQAARTQLGLRGTYATDRAARLGAEPLATAVRGLAATRPSPGRPATEERPAELFARTADWFVAAMLARDGRMNGALSSVQDLDLPGFAAATPPVPGTGSTDAMLEALGRVTPIAPTAAQWFRGRYGSGATRPATAIARLVLDASPSWGAERTLHALGLPVGLSETPAVGSSRDDARGGACPLEPWQRRLLWVSADARARGLLRAQAARASITGWPTWQSRATLGAPWRMEQSEAARERLRDAYLRAALRELRAATPFGAPAACH